MKFFQPKGLSIALPFAALAIFLVLSPHSTGAALQAPAAGAGGQAVGAPAGAPVAPGQGPGPGGAPGAPGGRGGAGGGRGAGAPPLGDGPWDVGEGENRVHVTVITKGLDHPWGMAILPNGDMLVTERAGRLRVIRKGVLDPTPISGLPQIRVLSLGGLLDIALHPNYAQNHLIYLAYSKPGDPDPTNSTLAVFRAKWDGGDALTEGKDIFLAEPHFGARGTAPRGCCGQGPSDGNSYGSRLAFDRAGFLYVTSGDRNYGEVAQDPSMDLGKILRLKDDGTIPSDNPFVGKAGYRPEIYSLGHRNPLGLTVDSTTGEIWSTEFGPRGGDELNRIQAGKNYGWMVVTEGTHYDGTPARMGKNSVAGYEDPVAFWVPVCARPCSFNPGNVTVYYGNKFPAWKGNILLGSMGSWEGDTNFVLRVILDSKGKVASQQKIMTGLGQRIRDVRTGPDGFIYLLTDTALPSGAMLRLEPGK
jgi:glucose/arabinose dehydrogenase